MSTAGCLDLLDGGDGEGGRFTGAGLGAADHVAAGQQQRYGLGLNVGGGGKAHLLDGAQYFGRKTQVGK